MPDIRDADHCKQFLAKLQSKSSEPEPEPEPESEQEKDRESKMEKMCRRGAKRTTIKTARATSTGEQNLKHEIPA